MLIFFFLWKLLQVYLLEINLVHFINTEKYTEHYLYKYTTIMIFAIQNSWNSVSAIFGFWYTKHKPALPLGSGVKIELIHHSLSLLFHQFSKQFNFSISVFSPAVTCYIRSIKCLNVMQHPINMPFPLWPRYKLFHPLQQVLAAQHGSIIHPFLIKFDYYNYQW